jgi:hypothetical protein
MNSCRHGNASYLHTAQDNRTQYSFYTTHRNNTSIYIYIYIYYLRVFYAAGNVTQIRKRSWFQTWELAFFSDFLQCTYTIIQIYSVYSIRIQKYDYAVHYILYNKSDICFCQCSICLQTTSIIIKLIRFVIEFNAIQYPTFSMRTGNGTNWIY